MIEPEILSGAYPFIDPALFRAIPEGCPSIASVALLMLNPSPSPYGTAAGTVDGRDVVLAWTGVDWRSNEQELPENGLAALLLILGKNLQWQDCRGGIST